MMQRATKNILLNNLHMLKYNLTTECCKTNQNSQFLHVIVQC